MKYQDMQEFHPRHCGFAMSGLCPDPTCHKSGHKPDILRLPVPIENPGFASVPSTYLVEEFIRRQRAHPGLGLVWWEWIPVSQL